MNYALITPEILSWAMKRSRLPADIVAKKIDIKEEKLLSWEKGEKFPTFNQAKELAKTLSIPFGYFYLSCPPKEEIPLPDLRTITDAKYREVSPEFLDLTDDVLRKQEWYREYLIEAGETPIDFIGKFETSDAVKTVASNMRDVLGINNKTRDGAGSWEDFLRAIIYNAEEKGILVLRSGIVGSNTHRKLSVEEFRGFSSYDDYAPLVFINSVDAKTAQIFTLAHEIAHIWIGESGISNINLRKLPNEQKVYIESFCDMVAAEFLVPEEDFLRSWKKEFPININLDVLVRKFRVSSVVILRRAYHLKQISRAEFFECYNDELSKQTKSAKKSGGGNFYNNFFARNSYSIASSVITSAVEGKTLYRDAARLLNVNVNKVNTLAASLGIRK